MKKDIILSFNDYSYSNFIPIRVNQDVDENKLFYALNEFICDSAAKIIEKNIKEIRENEVTNVFNVLLTDDICFDVKDFLLENIRKFSNKNPEFEIEISEIKEIKFPYCQLSGIKNIDEFFLNIGNMFPNNKHLISKKDIEDIKEMKKQHIDLAIFK